MSVTISVTISVAISVSIFVTFLTLVTCLSPVCHPFVTCLSPVCNPLSPICHSLSPVCNPLSPVKKTKITSIEQILLTKSNFWRYIYIGFCLIFSNISKSLRQRQILFELLEIVRSGDGQMSYLRDFGLLSWVKANFCLRFLIISMKTKGERVNQKPQIWNEETFWTSA